MNNKGTKTLLMSIIMSAPGPIILGVGLLLGQSNTQIADFIRRTIELLAIIASFIAYRIIVKKQLSDDQSFTIEKNTNIFVGATMLIAGVIMLCITFFLNTNDNGNVIMAFIVALLGVIANTIFWFRYKKLAKLEQSTILEVQSKLYRAKSFVDFCVTIALLSVMIDPVSAVSHYLDIIGSSVVSIYLGYSGIKIIIEKTKAFKKEN